MAFGESIRDGFERLPQSEARFDRNDTLRRLNRRGGNEKLYTDIVREDPSNNRQGLVAKVVERLGIGRFMRPGSPGS